MFHYYLLILLWIKKLSVGKFMMFKVKAKVAQSRPTLCDPIEYTVDRILQARILAWVAFSFSRGSFQLRD